MQRLDSASIQSGSSLDVLNPSSIAPTTVMSRPSQSSIPDPPHQNSAVSAGRVEHCTAVIPATSVPSQACTRTARQQQESVTGQAHHETNVTPATTLSRQVHTSDPRSQNSTIIQHQGIPKQISPTTAATPVSSVANHSCKSVPVSTSSTMASGKLHNYCIF
jgi:hypothetical protein